MARERERERGGGKALVAEPLKKYLFWGFPNVLLLGNLLTFHQLEPYFHLYGSATQRFPLHLVE